MLNALSKDRRLDVELVRKHIWLTLLFGVVKFVDAFGKLSCRLAISALKSVRFSVISIGIFLIAMLDENYFAELTKSGNGTSPTAFP